MASVRDYRSAGAHRGGEINSQSGRGSGNEEKGRKSGNM